MYVCGICKWSHSKCLLHIKTRYQHNNDHKRYCIAKKKWTIHGLTKLKTFSVEVKGTDDHNVFELFEEEHNNNKLNDEIYDAEQKKHTGDNSSEGKKEKMPC